jgi:hypothetical protein
MMARWLPQLVEFVSGFDKRRGDLAGGVGFEVGAAGVDCDDPTSHAAIVALRAHDAHLDAANHAAGALEAARPVVAVFPPAVSLPMGCLLRAGWWGMWANLVVSASSCSARCCAAYFPACSQFRRRRLSVPFRPVPVALTGAAFRIWVPTGAGRGCRGGHVR